DYLDVADMVRLGEHQAQIEAACNEDNQITHWGSFAWTVRPERSTTGNAMFFGAPMLGFGMPPRGVMVHLVAPGMNVAGMAFPGTPGVLIGHNERVAFTSTSGLMDTTDMFVETTNPENQHQYWHNGAWRDMESFESPFPVRNEDGTYRMQPLTVYRTVHGPVVDWNVGENRIYTRAKSFRGVELQSFLAFFDMNFAETLDDIETACRDIGSTHNVFAADIDGNIGYWLAGHVPVRSPKADPRLPVPGTGEYDWEGLVCHTDVVASVNPPEGWFANWNQKPSIETPLWFPEGIWGV
ncbi:MAG: penicillin acylase family protein, partial [bacterium]|nr:penicillin acylase family protein [bacterium]